MRIHRWRSAGLVALAWVAALLAGAASAADEDRGEVLFHLCTQCHGAAGAGDPAALAPAIAGLGQWYVEAQLQKFRQGIRGTHFDDIPGMRMLPMSRLLRSDEDVQAVAGYVANLPPADPEPLVTGGDSGRGEALYATCATCHGVAGEGNPKLQGPSLRNTGDWYLVSSLERYKSGARGSNPQDQTGALMRSMTGILPDEQAIRDVVAYIMTLPR